ncbi:hypothetical protein GCM10022394_17420 [Zobellella aerophila]|uniref:HTH-like domain-containing protein n=1 Tax=Zobellella aerophila TaxID=870480 RepID=A0ABP6VMF1_9GAMM
MTRKRRSFSSEFKLNAASLVFDQGYSIADASRSLDIGETILRRWDSATPAGKALTPEQQRIQELEARINRLFTASRASAGSRTLMLMMREQGHRVGRYRVKSLMKELGLRCKQPGSHAYKRPPLNGRAYPTG